MDDVAADARIGQFALHLLQPRPGRFEPRYPAQSIGGQDINIARLELGPSTLGLAQLQLIGGHLLGDEGARTVHLLTVGRHGRFDEQGEGCLHHITCNPGILVTIVNREEIAGLRRDANFAREAQEQGRALLLGGDALVEIGALDHLLQIGAAEQGALQNLDLAGR